MWLVPPFPLGSSLHVVGFDVMSEGGQSGGWHRVADMSSPIGACVGLLTAIKNYEVAVSLEWSANLVGWALRAKLGVWSACHNIAVHSCDLCLLGMKWHSSGLGCLWTWPSCSVWGLPHVSSALWPILSGGLTQNFAFVKESKRKCSLPFREDVLQFC